MQGKTESSLSRVQSLFGQRGRVSFLAAVVALSNYAKPLNKALGQTWMTHYPQTSLIALSYLLNVLEPFSPLPQTEEIQSTTPSHKAFK